MPVVILLLKKGILEGLDHNLLLIQASSTNLTTYTTYTLVSQSCTILHILLQP